MPKKKLLFISHGASLGGAVLSLYANIKHISREAYDIAVVLPREGPFSDILTKKGIKYYTAPLYSFYYCSLAKSFSFRNLQSFLKSIKNLIQFIPICLGNMIMLPAIIRKEDPDLVVLNSVVLLLSGVIARLMGKRVVWHVREVIATERSGVIKRTIASILNFSAEKVVALSAYSYQDLLRIGVRNIIIMPDGVDLCKFREASPADTRFNEMGLKPTDKVVGYIGQIFYEKGWPNLVKAAFLVTQVIPEAKFLVVGSGYMMRRQADIDAGYPAQIPRREHKNAFRRAVDEMKLSGNFIFLGQRFDVDHILRSVTCQAAISSVPEPLPRIILEALSSGVPVVASDSGAAPELVRDGVSGFLVRTNDSGELARAVINILRDPELAASMGGMGRKTAEGRFNIEKIVPELLKIYFPKEWESG